MCGLFIISFDSEKDSAPQSCLYQKIFLLLIFLNKYRRKTRLSYTKCMWKVLVGKGPFFKPSHINILPENKLLYGNKI